MSVPPTLPSPRRHDLDALRAAAMLLGIALHAALSFAPTVWMVRDSQQHSAFWWFFSAVHGFRMPLFFLISGYFTAMLWRNRGLKALLAQRFKRIFLPLVLGTITIVPLMWAVIIFSAKSGAREKPSAVQPAPAIQAGADIWTAAALGDSAAINRHLADGADVNGKHPDWGVTALSLAALHDRTNAISLLIEKGADVNLKNGDGGTPLHAAAFLGRAASVKLLLERGADPTARNQTGQTAQETMAADWNTTQLIASLLRLKIEREAVESGRAEAARHFREIGDAESRAERGKGKRKEDFRGLIGFLIYFPVFHHLWFLWFLCWLVAGFAVYARVADALKWHGPPGWLVLSPARFLWLIPLTMIPQWFMGQPFPVFGPDTSVGILPAPQILVYYAIFFGFGALYYDSRDDAGLVGKRWPAALAVSLLVILPIGLELTTGKLGFRNRILDPAWHRPAAVTLQVAYAWLMSFAFMGMFRSLLSTEKRWTRYMSDSAYWLYVAHLPLIVMAQLLVRDWQLPAVLKFVLICVVVTGFLLLTYQFMVRYTWIGTMLNGPRKRPAKPPPLEAATEAKP